MGSGSKLRNAIKKYGIESFEKKTLYIFDNKKDALKKEYEIVNEEFVNRKDTYNLTIGGNIPPNAKEWWSDIHSKTTSERMKGNQHKKGVKESEVTKQKKKNGWTLERRAFQGNVASDTNKKQWKNPEYRKKRQKHFENNNPMLNEESRKKVAASKVGLKKLTKGKVSKMAKPNSDKWNALISEGFVA